MPALHFFKWKDIRLGIAEAWDLEGIEAASSLNCLSWATELMHISSPSAAGKEHTGVRDQDKPLYTP